MRNLHSGGTYGYYKGGGVVEESHDICGKDRLFLHVCHGVQARAVWTHGADERSFPWSCEYCAFAAGSRCRQRFWYMCLGSIFKVLAQGFLRHVVGECK